MYRRIPINVMLVSDPREIKVDESFRRNGTTKNGEELLIDTTRLHTLRGELCTIFS